MIRLITAFFVLIGTAAAAQTLPAFYDVTGVASDDTLNVRIDPTAGAAIVGTLAPAQSGVEVTAMSPDQRWARVNLGEASGWAATRFLTLQRDYPFLPMAPLTCFGTEPFWSFNKPQTGPMTFSMMGGESLSWPEGTSLRSANRTDRFSIHGTANEGTVVITLARAACSDGMSDRSYGISTEILRLNDNPQLLSGCCSLQAD